MVFNHYGGLLSFCNNNDLVELMYRPGAEFL